MTTDIFDLRGVSQAIRSRRVKQFQEKILQMAARYPHTGFYMDEIDFDGLLCGPEEKNTPNLIGIAVRILVKQGAIHQTGDYRRSEKKESKGRLIFEYKIGRY